MLVQADLIHVGNPRHRAARDFWMKGTMETGDELREGRETETARLYRQAYRAGWNDALDELSRSACAGCSDEHWLKRELLRQAASMKRR